MWVFLIILIIFVVWPLVRAIIIGQRLRKQMRNAYEEAARRQNEYHNEQRRANRKAGWSGGKQRKKIINPGEGEYVEWEEVKITSETETRTTAEKAHTGATKGNNDSRRRVVDVEWEEVDADNR